MPPSMLLIVVAERDDVLVHSVREECSFHSNENSSGILEKDSLRSHSSHCYYSSTLGPCSARTSA